MNKLNDKMKKQRNIKINLKTRCQKKIASDNIENESGYEIGSH